MFYHLGFHQWYYFCVNLPYMSVVISVIFKYQQQNNNKQAICLSFYLKLYFPEDTFLIMLIELYVL